MAKVHFVEGEALIDRVRDIVREKQFATINGCVVDLFSASAIVKVYDAVNEANKRKLESLPVTKLAVVCMRMIS